MIAITKISLITMNDVTKKIIKEMMNYASTITFPVNSKSEIDGILDVVRYKSISTFHVGTISYYYHPLRRLVELLGKHPIILPRLYKS